MGGDKELIWRRGPAERVRAIVPWLIAMGISAVLMFATDGVERAAAAGAFVATIAGVLVALTQSRAMISSMRRWLAQHETTLDTFADDRAAAVARQFQWAVEELVNVRAELRRTDALRVEAEQLATRVTEAANRDLDALRAARERLTQAASALRDEERRRRSAEQRVEELTQTLELFASRVEMPVTEMSALALDWTLEYDGTTHSLRLRSTRADLRPGAARILDASGRLVAESPAARQVQPAQLVMVIPQSVAAAVESGDWTAFALEVVIDGAWRSAVLVHRGMSETEDRPQRAAFRIVS
jgi:hypothetical protein